MRLTESRQRVIIEAVSPEVDSGRVPAKSIAGDTVNVEADIYADGHDTLSARLLYRRDNEKDWKEAPMRHLINDRWQGAFIAAKAGNYIFTITAWVDRFQSWCQDLKKRNYAGQEDISVYLMMGSRLIIEASQRATEPDRRKLIEYAERLKSDRLSQEKKVELALSDEIKLFMEKHDDRQDAATYSRELTVLAEREKAIYGAWYEMFPHSASGQPKKYGSFKDCENRLPYVASMGFDVLYFPPIHPVGKTNRKGKNNAVTCQPGDPGTPWAIGSEDGGHKAINPLLGTLEDFKHLISEAKKHGIEIAMDIAFQCSPDHPYVKEYPEWFLWRPDGTVQYAENPRRNTRIFTLSTLPRNTGGNSGRSLKASSFTGQSRGSGSSAWTIPIPSPFSSGSGLSPG